MTQRSSPLRGATIRRLGRITRGSGIDAWPCWILWTAGDGTLETAKALPGVRLATCWPRLGAGCLRPVTLASQVTKCSCSSSPRSADASRPADGSRGARLEASEASAVAASGGSGVTWIATRGGVDDRARHLEPLQPFGGEPLGDDRDHAPAGGDPGPQRVHQQTGLFGRRRLGDGIDAALGADEALGFEPEDHDRPESGAIEGPARASGLTLRCGRGERGRKVRRMLFLPSGHRATIEAEEGIQSNPDASSAGSM